MSLHKCKQHESSRQYPPSLPKSTTSPMKVFSHENNFEKSWETKCKRTIINVFKEFKKLRENMKKHLSEVRENEFKENKYLGGYPR